MITLAPPLPGQGGCDRYLLRVSGSKGEIEIRDAVHADVPRILEIYNHAILTSVATADLEPLSLEQRLEWLHQHQEHGYPVLVALDKGNLVGWASLSSYSHKRGYQYTAEDSVYICPDNIGRGLGPLLLEALLERARADGFHSIIARIDSKNDVSIRMHERFGFVVVGTFRDMVHKFGRYHDSVHMQLLIG